MIRHLARGIAVQTGLNWTKLPPGEEGAPPHCHSAEEALFVILDGTGTLEPWAKPDPASRIPRTGRGNRTTCAGIRARTRSSSAASA
jgi:hypothetical protein